VSGDRGTKRPIKSFRDLEVYQKLLALHLEVNELTMQFPKHELYELGAQLRRASNSAPANVAEGWNNKHTNIYLEGINRASGELQETTHHLDVALQKRYVETGQHAALRRRYEECGKMLWGLTQAVRRFAEAPVPIT
jgi:four helix bundle protein